MCFPSIAPQQFGKFHFSSKSLAIFFHSSSWGTLKTFSCKFCQMAAQVSPTIFVIVEGAIRYAYDKEAMLSPEARYLQIKYNRKLCFVLSLGSDLLIEDGANQTMSQSICNFLYLVERFTDISTLLLSPYQCVIMETIKFIYMSQIITIYLSKFLSSWIINHFVVQDNLKNWFLHIWKFTKCHCFLDHAKFDMYENYIV